MDKIFLITSEKEYEEYKNNFINKWKSIFTNDSNQYKTYQSRKTEIFSDFEPLGHYIICSVLSEKNKNLIDIKEFKI